MDGALGSSRDGPADRSGGGGNYYGGGGGGGRHRSGGRGRGGGGRHSNNNRRHQPYGGRDNRDRPPSRGRGPRPPGNRFQTTSTTSVNQETAMEKQLSAMVSRVGDLKAAPEEYGGKRPVVQVMSKNIGDLVAVFTNPGNAALFLRYQSLAKHDVDMSMEGEDTPQQIKPTDQAGSLVHLVISCVCTLPLQTGCYAAITMAVDEKAPDEFKGFAGRCLTYASLYLARDFDTMLLETDADVSMCMNRLQHMLKYFAMLSKLGVVCPYDQSEDPTGTSELTMAAFLMALVAASVKMAHHNHSVAALLAHLVLSTVPYVTDCIPHDFIMTHLLEPLEQQVLGSFVYKSSFSPGVGKSALLLNTEQQEDNDDDEEDDDTDDKDEEDASAQCCDTLQDSLRSVKKLVAEGTATTRFALLTDAPWDGLVKQFTIKSEEDTDFSSDEPLVYSSEPLRLSLTAASILAIVNDIGVDLQCFHVEGVIFGRLPIFGSPAEEVDEDEMETTANESLQAYQKGYGQLDRFFLSDAIRDVLMSHQSSVSDTGLDRGTAKNAAEQCWAVCHIMLPLVDGEDDGKGIEYPIVEVILSLILQATESGTLRHIYLCRVLVELIRLKPDLMPQALAIGVSNLVQFYLPSLVPLARDNFSRWFSYHMTNLDYQWPSAFWEQWGAYVGKRSSRSDFVTRALMLMAANVSSPSLLVKDCLPAGSRLVTCLLGTSEDEGAAGVFASLGLEIRDRIWEKNEDPDQLRAYILSDEVSETITGGSNLDDSDSGSFWWRTNALIHGLLHSAERHQAQTKEAIESACSDRGDVIEVDDGNEDVYGATMESIIRYKTVMIAVLAKDAEAYDERLNLQGEARPTEMELLESTQVYLLQQVQIILPNSRTILEGCINCFVENQLVDVRSILRFLLDGKTKLVERWWEIASAVMRLELDKAVTNVDDSLGTLLVIDVGNDDVDSATSKRASPLIAFMEPLIELLVGLVCDLLLSKQGGDLSKKLTPDEVDLVEGLKLVLLSSMSTLMNKLKATGDEGVKGVSESKGRALIKDSNMSEAKLASLCRNKGSTPALDALARILEAM
jgi:MIF4G like